MESCAACGAPLSDAAPIQGFDRLHGTPGAFEVRVCGACGSGRTFPLAFVAERLRPLPWIGAAALALQVLLAWVFAGLLELDGLVIALTLSTFAVLLALLRELDALSDGVRGAVAAATIAVFTVVAFLPAGLVLGSLAAGIAGLVAYVAVVALARPRGLRASWAYLRALQ